MHIPHATTAHALPTGTLSRAASHRWISKHNPHPEGSPGYHGWNVVFWRDQMAAGRDWRRSTSALVVRVTFILVGIFGGVLLAVSMAKGAH